MMSMPSTWVSFVYNKKINHFRHRSISSNESQLLFETLHGNKLKNNSVISHISAIKNWEVISAIKNWEVINAIKNWKVKDFFSCLFSLILTSFFFFSYFIFIFFFPFLSYPVFLLSLHFFFLFLINFPRLFPSFYSFFFFTIHCANVAATVPLYHSQTIQIAIKQATSSALSAATWPTPPSLPTEAPRSWARRESPSPTSEPSSPPSRPTPPPPDAKRTTLKAWRWVFRR